MPITYFAQVVFSANAIVARDGFFIQPSLLVGQHSCQLPRLTLENIHNRSISLGHYVWEQCGFYFDCLPPNGHGARRLAVL